MDNVCVTLQLLIHTQFNKSSTTTSHPPTYANTVVHDTRVGLFVYIQWPNTACQTRAGDAKLKQGRTSLEYHIGWETALVIIIVL